MMGWIYDINIYSNCNLEISEIIHKSSKSKRTAAYRLMPSELDSLLENIDNLSKIKLSNYGFGINKPFDLPVTKFKYELDSLADSSRIYFPDKNEMPEELAITLSMIERLLVKYDKIH